MRHVKYLQNNKIPNTLLFWFGLEIGILGGGLLWLFLLWAWFA